MTVNDPATSARVVRDLVGRADRARRGRDRMRLIARLAPLAGLAALAVAVIGRFARWPVPATLAAVACSGMTSAPRSIAYVLVAR